MNDVGGYVITALWVLAAYIGASPDRREGVKRALGFEVETVSMTCAVRAREYWHLQGLLNGLGEADSYIKDAMRPLLDRPDTSPYEAMLLHKAYGVVWSRRDEVKTANSMAMVAATSGVRLGPCPAVD
ncbi:hypothetical protein [Paenirhodobacter sp.]|uniref:hypothetical protein n=1 Tax=Paenirhodobacter sp. TaxID=1965326 RepID=UPI003B3EE8ED